MAGMAITAADPNGVWGLLKEGIAGGGALLEARQNAQTHPLVRAVAEDFATAEEHAREYVIISPGKSGNRSPRRHAATGRPGVRSP